MPFFKYVAREKTGKVIEEIVEAMTEEELVQTLQSSGRYVISIALVQKELAQRKKKVIKRRFHYRVSRMDTLLFCKELAVLLAAGVTLIKSLDILSNQITSQPLLKAVEMIKKDIEGGYTFQNALKKHTKIFSEFWLSLVEVGEVTGHLPTVLEQLAIYLEESADLRKKVVSASIYPMVLMSVALIVISVFLLKVVPIFSEIFKGFNMELPKLTNMIIGLSIVVKKYFFICVGAIISIVVLIKKYISTEMGRWQFDKLIFNLPIIGQISKEISTERFASELSTLLGSGVPILHALEIAEKTTGNKIMRKEVEEVKIGVKNGKGMAEIMEKSDLFFPLMVQMIKVGEEIGELDKMLKRVSVFYKERVSVFVSRLGVIIEPIALVFMGIIIGILVIGMFMPIFNISSAIKNVG